MYDEVKSSSKQNFVVITFEECISKDELIMVTDKEDHPIAAFSSLNDYKIAVFSSPDVKNKDYLVYRVSSVTGNKKENIYYDITAFENAVKLNSINIK